MIPWILSLDLNDVAASLDESRQKYTSGSCDGEAYFTAIAEAGKVVAARIRTKIVEPLQSEQILTRRDMGERQKIFLAKRENLLKLAEQAEEIAEEFETLDAFLRDENMEEMLDGKLEELYDFGDYGRPDLKLCWISFNAQR